MTEYEEFLKRKQREFPPTGFEPPSVVHPKMFDYQDAVTRWSIRRGRSAMFLGTGLGKSLCSLAWSSHVHRHTRGRVLMLAPLAVATQTSRDEATKWAIDGVKYLREDDGETPIVVTNYDMMDHFDAAQFAGVVLGESSILKHFDAKMCDRLIGKFYRTVYKLCETATPAPNDYTELGNHAEFLGVCTREEMLATFFCHDGGTTQDWRLKRHAQKDFWRWVSSWAVMLRKPSDLGYDDTRHILPPLRMHQHTVSADGGVAKAAGILFASEATSLASQREARRGSLSERVEEAVKIIRAEPDETWLVWCDLNGECDAMEKAVRELGISTVQIAGADTIDDKESRMLAFIDGTAKCLVTKSTIAGFGVNLQHCARNVCVGVSHSFERMFQLIRRTWRFGQTRPVDVHVVVSSAELSVVENLKRKETDADRMAEAMVAAMAENQWAAVKGSERQTDTYNPTVPMVVPSWCKTEENEQ